MQKIHSVSISVAKGVANRPADLIELDEYGVQGDRHGGPGVRQVTLFDWELMQARAPQTPLADLPGTQNENIAVEGLDGLHILPLDLLQAGEALLEVTILGDKFTKGSKHVCADHDEANKRCDMEHDGIFARVLAGGTVRPGDPLTHQRRTLRTTLITLSDRVSKGKAEDRSGERIAELLGTWCADSMWELTLDRHIIPDEADQLGALLHHARKSKPHLIITTGGTGISPRDITPEVVTAHVDKILPGIMEHIRTKYGAQKSLALLSRSVAGVMGETLVFALPGSPRGVDEYMHELTPLFEHMLLTVRGIDPH
jgi:molybdopterin adenylyltransferase